MDRSIPAGGPATDTDRKRRHQRTPRRDSTGKSFRAVTSPNGVATPWKASLPMPPSDFAARRPGRWALPGPGNTSCGHPPTKALQPGTNVAETRPVLAAAALHDWESEDGHAVTSRDG